MDMTTENGTGRTVGVDHIPREKGPTPHWFQQWVNDMLADIRKHQVNREWQTITLPPLPTVLLFKSFSSTITPWCTASKELPPFSRTSQALAVALPKSQVQMAIGSIGVLPVSFASVVSLQEANNGADNIPAATVLEFLRNFLLFMGLVLYF